jgi:plastocyanin
VVVSVTLTDSRLRLSASTSHKVHVIAFRVVNRGKKTHNFVIGVVRSPKIKPGGTAHLVAYFPDYGRYRFACTLHCGAALHGVFSVNR